MKVAAASRLASKPACAIPTGSSQSAHIQASTTAKPTTHSPAATFARRAAAGESFSVSIVIAKSSRSRVIAEPPMKASQTTE